MRKDVISGAALLALAAAYYWASLSILEGGFPDDSGVGARTLPTVVAALLAVVAVTILIRALVLAGPAKEEVEPDKEPEATALRALGLVVLGAVYIPLADGVGYVPSIFLLLCVVPLYEGAKLSWRVFAIAAGGALFFWLLFVVFLGVAQPAGLLF